MLLNLSGGLSAFTVLPALQYGEVPDVPDWLTRLYLDMLCPSPLPASPAPAVIYIHGGAWAEGERSTALYPWLNPLLAAHGFITVSITYRFSRYSPFPAQIYDAKAAVRWLRAHAEEYHIDPERIGAWGDSAGGHLASLLGLTPDVPELEGNCGSPGYSSRVQAVAARSTPYSFFPVVGRLTDDVSPLITLLFGGPLTEREELVRLASPLSHVHPSAPPFQIVHGTLDELASFKHAEQFAEGLKAAGNEVDFYPIQGGHHNLRLEQELPWTETPWEEWGWKALEFFQRHLG